jgi:hypothetical protein
MIAGRASGNQIAPFILTTAAARNYVIDRQVRNVLATVLADVTIAP